MLTAKAGIFDDCRSDVERSSLLSFVQIFHWPASAPQTPPFRVGPRGTLSKKSTFPGSSALQGEELHLVQRVSAILTKSSFDCQLLSFFFQIRMYFVVEPLRVPEG
jgi:hypothetical protein